MSDEDEDEEIPELMQVGGPPSVPILTGILHSLL
jgi:hypothetical protein